MEAMVDPLHEEVTVKAKFKFSLHTSYFILNFWLQISALLPAVSSNCRPLKLAVASKPMPTLEVIPPSREWELSPGIFFINAVTVRVWKPWWWKLCRVSKICIEIFRELLKNWDTINTGPGIRGPGTRDLRTGTGDPRTGNPRTQILEGCVAL